MSKARQKWNDLARYDLETARAMMTSGRYLYVLFCCQQAAEKAVKGIVEEILDLARGVSADLAAETLRRTEEFVEWLESTQ